MAVGEERKALYLELESEADRPG
nr:hypothetical protein [Thermus hydrothermalis]